MKHLVFVYRCADGRDCSMNGITAQKEMLTACWNEHDLYSLPSQEEINTSDVVIKADIICGDLKTLRAFVIQDGKIKKGGGWCDGGNFVYSCDGRFPRLGDFGTPISVHDRDESLFLP